MVYKNCGGDYVTIFTDDENFCDTPIPENTDLNINNIATITDSVPPSLQIGCKKYSIYFKNIYLILMPQILPFKRLLKG